MHFSKLSQIAVLLIAINLAASGNAQSNSDFMALVSKTSSGEFDVEGAVEVDHAEALELHKAGVVFVDVRREIQYNMRHIAGAIGLELKSQLSEQSLAEQVAKDQKVVFYCSDRKCYRSAHASAKAITWGYTDVVYYSEGWVIWTAEGYPFE